MSIVLALALLLQSAGGRQVEITVRDAQGLAIEGARITVTEKTTGGRKTATSSAEATRVDGLSAGEYEVRVEKDGFTAQTTPADLRTQNSANVSVQLEVGGLSKNVVVSVTRTEQEVGNLPASITLVSNEDLKASPAIATDDILRQIPTFSLFRRTSSLAAHPTAQGVSLRGVGPSGVSRTLVLVDGVPFNDPFGGWVYWTRIPMGSVRQVEVVESPSSSVYGNYALGGVMNIVTARPEGTTFKLRTSVGGRQTWKEDFFAAGAWDKFGAAIEGTVLDTNGYYLVPLTEGGVPLRGPVDTRAAVNNENFNIKLDFSPTDRISAYARTGYFNEHRINGKFGETNDSMWKYVSGGTRIRLADGSDIQGNLWGNFERFHSLFLAISSVGGVSRNTSRLTLRQAVPTKDTGGSVQWSKAIGSRNFFTVGTDWRWVDGDSNEEALNAPPANTALVNIYRNSGGTQKSEGLFIQDLISLTSKFQLTLSARLDHWRNYDSHNLETSAATGLPAPANAPSCDTSSATNCLRSKKNTIGSPKVGAVYHVNEKISLWSSASWGFRAPTLNELYRQFRVGTVLTLANEKLGPERLVAGEWGVNYSPVRNLTWRSTGFVNRFTNPVSNVTQSAVGANITRKRQNLSRTRIWGIQSDMDYRLKTNLKFGMSYVYNIAKVRASIPDAQGANITGNYLPEVPRHRATAEVMYSNPKYVTASASMQIVGGQYDDDLNTLWLPYYNTLDINFMRKVGRNMEAFFGVQNVLDRTFYVQRVPTSVAAPRFFTGGLEISWNGR
jgi:outer membrane receptor protein involved in Fe transport